MTYYERNRERCLTNVKARQARLVIQSRARRAAAGCASCAEKNPLILCDTKTGVLCCNCHREKKADSNAASKHSEVLRGRQWLSSIKSKSGCARCGHTDPRALDFHHRDPFTKFTSVSCMVACYAKATIINEIAKCDVLCANCHRLTEADLNWTSMRQNPTHIKIPAIHHLPLR